MKRTPLKTKTPLRNKTPFKVKNTPRGSKLAPKDKKKKKAPNIGQLQKKLWRLCKAVIRVRYGSNNGTFTCYTCDIHLDIPKKAQTGHFIPSSVCSAFMRYNLDNLRIQCFQCNINKSGNWIEYEKRLNIDNGTDFAEKLKQLNEETKGKQYDSIWYENKIKEYKAILETY